LDRDRTRVEALVAELLAQHHDLVGERLGHLARAAMRTPRARHQTHVALGAVAGKELVDPAAMHAVRGRELSDRPALPQMRLDQIPAHVHRSTPRSGVSHVLTHPSPIS
jgi:hypothetical protein